MKKALILLAAMMPLPAAGGAGAEAIERLPAERFADWYYSNPSNITNIGDPFILDADGAWWCFATSSGAGFKAWRSEDLANWEPQGLVYKMGPKTWGRANFWAPEVYRCGGKYCLLYSAKQKGSDRMSIGLAASDSPGGPYLDLSDGPLFDPGYSVIDASLFVDDDGQPYLYYARDCSENVVRERYHISEIYGVPLKEDLSGADGEPEFLATPDFLSYSWEQPAPSDWLWNEGPVLQKRGDDYWLFYSANYFESREYAVGAAWSDGPLGKFHKLYTNPLLSWQEAGGKVAVSGPGHNSFLAVGGEQFMVYHTHSSALAPSGDRQMALDRFGYRADGIPYVNGPTLFPQLRPLALTGLENLLPGAAASGGAPDALGRLTDGDYGVSQASAACAWSPESAADAWAEFKLPRPREVEAVLIYARKGAQGTGRVLLDGGAIPFDLGRIEDVPGACLRLHFAPRRAEVLRIELDQPAALFEVIALARAAS